MNQYKYYQPKIEKEQLETLQNTYISGWLIPGLSERQRNCGNNSIPYKSTHLIPDIVCTSFPLCTIFSTCTMKQKNSCRLAQKPNEECLLYVNHLNKYLGQINYLLKSHIPERIPLDSTYIKTCLPSKWQAIKENMLSIKKKRERGMAWKPVFHAKSHKYARRL